ncbi:hypothetical protein OG462_07145 [Streptomyces sp. NBC_01077]|uniref:hypothetical protein n=1 Tax=Streptomyces sp. NBC_01077 TaxID=2903746 RepID=UPI00386B7C78|nr:hypothetical protein OG462_07145 [Streptomyces sp. NBC_01077]
MAGCSPELRPLAAVYVDRQGTAHALLRSCDNDGLVRGPGLRGSETRATEEATPGTAHGTAPEATPTEEPWIGWETRGAHKAADFPLFAPPPQWAAETRGQQTLRPGYSYELDFADPGDSYAYRASVTFDARQLAGVPAGEVLTHRGTMTREAFEDLAREAC